MGLCNGHYQTVPHGYIDATEAIERYNDLRARGLSTRAISRLTGVSRDALCRMGTYPQGNIRIETHDRIMAVRIPNAIQRSGVLLPATGTHRRIQALCVAGHSLGTIGAHLSITQQAVTEILGQQSVTAETATKISDLFEKLQMTPGTSNRVRIWAAKRGWLPALAWDNIDDPDEAPDLTESTLSFPERYEELRDIGIISDQHIAQRMGISPESLQRQLFRYGMYERRSA